MVDIFSEEVSKILEDRARDKLKHVYKRRKVYKKRDEQIKGLKSPECHEHKMPGTPTTLTFMVEIKQREKKRITQNEVENQKQKVSQKVCAVRRRRKLECKIRAKQPRTVF